MPHVPTVLQRYTYDCGPAAVRAVCRAFGKRTPRVRCGRRDGTPTRNVVEAFAAAGLATVAGVMDAADLCYHLSRGRLVLCTVPVGKDGHWVIASLVRDGCVLIHDPAFGPRAETLPAFVRRWSRCGREAVAVGRR